MRYHVVILPLSCYVTAGDRDEAIAKALRHLPQKVIVMPRPDLDQRMETRAAKQPRPSRVDYRTVES